MNTFLAEVRETLLPTRDSKYGLLPPLLIGMTIVSGLVDAFTYLALSHVLVANMTGNVVFLAFALVGVSGFSIAAFLIALGAFLLGALGGGAIAARLGERPGRLLGVAASAQSIFLAAAVVLSAFPGQPPPGGFGYSLVAMLGVAMGIQNASARRLAVPDLTTTVLTMTLTGLASDVSAVGGSGSKAGRRLVAVAAMLVGALVGAALVLSGHATYPLAIALLLTAGVAVTAFVALGGWRRSGPTRSDRLDSAGRGALL